MLSFKQPGNLVQWRMQEQIDDLKKSVFYRMLEIAGRVFIVVNYSEEVVIGNRGFTEEEKRDGIVLVFNRKMHFSWDDSGISTTLVFGTSPQKCHIPAASISMIYSPELHAQFILAPPPGEKGKEDQHEEAAGPNVVQVDFKKKAVRKRRQ